MKAIKQVLKKYPNAAMLIGNGPNLSAGIMPSWSDLLVAAGDQRIRFPYDELTNTEIYDLVELYAKPTTDVKKRVIDQLKLRKTDDLSVHKRLMNLAQENDSPVLTTNFDAGFETSIDAGMKRINSQGFTRYYPWKNYYSIDELVKPCGGFGIWKVHGDVKYKDSIRLGLTDYMGSSERARDLISKGAGRLGNTHRTNPWNGHETWLDIWFSKPIIIFGLGYGKDEVFLRWLLIERRRFFNKTGRDMDVTYIDVKGATPNAPVYNLMKNLGVTLKLVKGFDEIYG
ncbi:MAG: hypothetical protein ABJM06_11820 [Gilvibacter sp.]